VGAYRAGGINLTRGKPDGVLAATVLFVFLNLWSPARIVFVRHGETEANATGRYSSRTIDTFSERGAREVAALTARLDAMRFDAIVVSPSPRALKTIAPYLRKHGLKAEIWPELYECCDAHSRKIKGYTSPNVRYGATIRVPADLAPCFILDTGDDRLILAPSYDDGLRQIRLAGQRLRREFGGTGKTVLVVGHSLNGGRLIEDLEGKPLEGRVRPDNAKPIPLDERPDGRFGPAVRAELGPRAGF